MPESTTRKGALMSMPMQFLLQQHDLCMDMLTVWTFRLWIHEGSARETVPIRIGLSIVAEKHDAFTHGHCFALRTHAARQCQHFDINAHGSA